MGFFDDPKVDSSSEISEDSVLATKRAFRQKNGFLVREETPDKGVDLDVELVVDNQVSGFKFAIQIKSCKLLEPKKKKGKLYVAYHIKTSRLGYLCRRTPGLGLIVLYDDEQEVAYFDFVEEIYKRLMEMNGNEGWMNNESVTFHIPLENLLDDTKIKKIHDIMKKRSQNFNALYSSMANDFDLPTFNHEELNDPSHLLKKYGLHLFNTKNYNVIYGAISKISLYKLTQSPKLLLLAAITYHQIGKNVEGDFFLSKCNRFLNEYDEEEVELLNLTKLASDFNFGRLDLASYYNKLLELADSIKVGLNAIGIDLKLLFLDLLNKDIVEDDNILSSLAAVEAVGNKIIDLSVEDEVKYLCMLELVTFQFYVGMKYYAKFISQIALKNRMLGQEMPLQDRIDAANLVMLLTGKPQEFLKYVWDYSLKHNEQFLEGVVLFKKAYMFHTFLFHSMSASFQTSNNLDDFRESFPNDLVKDCYNGLLRAYNIFYEKGDLQQAYRTLSLIVEINYLFSVVNGGNINDIQLGDVVTIRKKIAQELEIHDEQTVTEDMVLALFSRTEGNHYEMYTSLDDDEMIKMFTWVVKSTGIPQERVVNMISEFDFMKRAVNAVDVKYFDIFQNLSHTKSLDTLYKDPLRYTICCKKCDYETLESENLDILLARLRAEHGYVCI